MPHGKVLITDDVHALLINGLEQLGFICDVQPKITDAEVRFVIQDYAGVIINSKINVDKLMLDAATQLQFIGRVGSGMEIVDISYATKKGIAVLSSPQGNRNAVAEHALGMLLSLLNHLNRANTEVKNFDWQREKNRGEELLGKKIGIIGFGNTGSSFAAKLLGFGCEILIYDKFLKPGFVKKFLPKNFSAKNFFAPHKSFSDDEIDTQTFNYNFSTYREATLTEIQNTCDVISLHLPLTGITRRLVDVSFLEKCKDDLILINTSRGECVDTLAVLKQLQAQKMRGACLDVFENEKVNTFNIAERFMYSELYKFDNVIVSPHIAGWTVQSKERLARILLGKIKATLSIL